MITNQVYVFRDAFIVGLVLGVLFDLFRILRKRHVTPKYLVYLQDLVLIIIASGIIIISAFITNDGEIRGYMVLRLYDRYRGVFAIT